MSSKYQFSNLPSTEFDYVFSLGRGLVSACHRIVGVMGREIESRQGKGWWLIRLGFFRIGVVILNVLNLADIKPQR
jgi:hypothetical protein